MCGIKNCKDDSQYKVLFKAHSPLHEESQIIDIWVCERHVKILKELSLITINGKPFVLFDDLRIVDWVLW